MISRGTVYLSGVRKPITDQIANFYGDMIPLGILVTPVTADYLKPSRKSGCGINVYNRVAVDNGCFAKPESFNPDAYLRLIGDALDRCGDTLLFATAPDVFDKAAGVGDWAGTLARSLPFLPRIRAAGCPAALVIQDGATIETTPWDELDAVFIGASTAWKLSPAAASICREAQRRGKWVHMGRVNSLKRLRIAAGFSCDSADGTHLAIAGADNGTDNVRNWLRGVYGDHARRFPAMEHLTYDGCAA